MEFRIFHIDDSPHRIAFGAAMGLFIAYLPPLGYHIILALIFPVIFKANKAAAITCVWLNNPATFIPIAYHSYIVGRITLAWFKTAPALDKAKVSELLAKYFSFTEIITHFHKAQFWQQLGSFLSQIGLEVFIGGLIIGTVVATVGYIVVYKIIVRYRRKHPHLRFKQYHNNAKT